MENWDKTFVQTGGPKDYPTTPNDEQPDTERAPDSTPRSHDDRDFPGSV